MRDRHIARSEIDQAPWDKERRDTARPSFLEYDCCFSNARQPTDSGADHHAGSNLIVVARWFPTGILQSLSRGAHGKNNEVVDLALLLRLHPVIGAESTIRAVATRDLTGDLGSQVRNVEIL